MRVYPMPAVAVFERNIIDMRVGVLTSVNGNVEENIKKVKELGLDNCQLKCWNENFLTDEYAEKTAAALKEYGVDATGFWCGWQKPAVWNFYDGPLTLGIVPRDYRYNRVGMLLKGAKFAAKLGITDVITHAGFIPENPCTTEYHEVVACVRYIATNLLARGQYFLFETGQETPITLLRLIEDVGTGNLGINLDPANLLMYGKANPVDSLRVFGKYVRGIHGKDGEYPTNGKSLGRERPMGEGLVNYPLFIKRLKEIGYDGAITIEREISGEKQIEDILMAKGILEKLFDEYGCRS